MYIVHTCFISSASGFKGVVPSWHLQHPSRVFPMWVLGNLDVTVLRQGWVFSKRMCVFSGIYFTTHFIEFVVMETKQIVRSNSNVILRRQTCGQRSGMAAGRALAFYFSVRIFYVFPMSKCRGESDLSLCMISVLAKRMPLRSADFRRILRPNTF